MDLHHAATFAHFSAVDLLLENASQADEMGPPVVEKQGVMPFGSGNPCQCIYLEELELMPMDSLGTRRRLIPPVGSGIAALLLHPDTHDVTTANRTIVWMTHLEAAILSLTLFT